MPFYSEHRCSDCEEICSKELLTAKRIQFYGVGTTKIIRSRVDKWLCEKCRDKDPDYMKAANSGPAHQSPSRNRVRQAQNGTG